MLLLLLLPIIQCASNVQKEIADKLLKLHVNSKNDDYFDNPELFNENTKNAPFRVWNDHTCSMVVNLFSATGRAIQKINNELKDKQKAKDKPTQLRSQALKMLAEELIESERWIFSALHLLKETVKSSSANSLDQIVKNSKLRLEDLQYATLREEEKCDKLEEILFQIKELKGDEHHNVFYNLIEDILEDLGVAADSLEDTLRDKLMPIRPHRGDIETVKKILLKDEKVSQTLEDVHGNRYVLSLPADKTQPTTDPPLLFSSIILLLLSGLLSALCNLIWVPTIFGQILTGVILGPSGFNFIQNPVQVETIGEIGVFLILFCCGMEFSPTSLRKVWRISVGGSLSILFMLIVSFSVCGAIFDVPISQCVFVSLCLSFSSTALIIKFLSDDKSLDVAGLRDSMLGMLVLQDVQISVIMGLLPILAGFKPTLHRTAPHVHIRKLLNVDTENDFDHGTLIFVGVFCVSSLVIIFTIGRKMLLRMVNKTANEEVLTLLPLSLCFTILLLTEKVGISMEVGCFLAGFMIRSFWDYETTLKLITPARDIFSVLFFSGIGLHVYPTFVWSELSLIIVLTLFVVSVKYLVCLLVLQPLANDLQRSVISAGLAQVSEFSFVLASRGRKLDLVNREIYLLILSVTATSLIISPLIWKVSLLHARRSTVIGENQHLDQRTE